MGLKGKGSCRDGGMLKTCMGEGKEKRRGRRKGGGV